VTAGPVPYNNAIKMLIPPTSKSEEPQFISILFSAEHLHQLLPELLRSLRPHAGHDLAVALDTCAGEGGSLCFEDLCR